MGNSLIRGWNNVIANLNLNATMDTTLLSQFQEIDALDCTEEDGGKELVKVKEGS